MWMSKGVETPTQKETGCRNKEREGRGNGLEKKFSLHVQCSEESEGGIPPNFSLGKDHKKTYVLGK